MTRCEHEPIVGSTNQTGEALNDHRSHLVPHSAGRFEPMSEYSKDQERINAAHAATLSVDDRTDDIDTLSDEWRAVYAYATSHNPADH